MATRIITDLTSPPDACLTCGTRTARDVCVRCLRRAMREWFELRTFRVLHSSRDRCALGDRRKPVKGADSCSFVCSCNSAHLGAFHFAQFAPILRARRTRGRARRRRRNAQPLECAYMHSKRGNWAVVVPRIAALEARACISSRCMVCLTDGRQHVSANTICSF